MSTDCNICRRSSVTQPCQKCELLNTLIKMHTCLRNETDPDAIDMFNSVIDKLIARLNTHRGKKFESDNY